MASVANLLEHTMPRLFVDLASTVGGTIQLRVVEHDENIVRCDVDV